MASFNFLKYSSSLILVLFLLSQISATNAHYKDEGLDVDLSERGLILVKVWCLIIIFLATFLSGLIPYFFRSKSNFLVLGNHFAAGVFVTISIHFGNDSVDIMYPYMEGSAALTFVMVLVGYGLIMLLESILLMNKSKDVENGGIVQGRIGDDSVADNILPKLVRRAAVEVAVILILGLALHSAFEGMTIGVAERPRYAWRYLWTISIQKIFVGIGLGFVVLRMQPTRQFVTSVIYSFAFAIATPIGIIVAFIIKESAKRSDTTEMPYAFTQAIFCGVFLHISIYHLLAKGVNCKLHDQCSCNTPFRKFLAFLVGVGGVASFSFD